MIGGLILVALGTIAALRGLWQIFSGPDFPPGPEHAELNGLKVLGGQVLLVLAAILIALGALAAYGGRRTRLAVGVVGVVFGALMVVAGISSSALVVALGMPFFVSAYILLRAASRSA